MRNLQIVATVKLLFNPDFCEWSRCKMERDHGEANRDAEIWTYEAPATNTRDEKYFASTFATVTAMSQSSSQQAYVDGCC